MALLAVGADDVVGIAIGLDEVAVAAGMVAGGCAVEEDCERQGQNQMP